MNRPSLSSRRASLVVFLGPSLPQAEAEARFGCRVLPPARQGDVLRALAQEPLALVLVDGVFEAQPSVWHREILAALDAGVAVFGASSMGALRAAELAELGMVGVGTIFDWVRRGVVEDDSEVALLHADAEHHYRPLTVPLVNVRHAVACARKSGVLGATEARRLLEHARHIFYQERTWPRVLAALGEAARHRWQRWAKEGLEDLKRADALRCLEVAGRFADAASVNPVRAAQGSSWLRRAQLVQGASVLPEGGFVDNARVLAELEAAPDAHELTSRGLQRALLARMAEGWGLRVDPDTQRDLADGWLEHLRTLLPKCAGDARGLFAGVGVDAGQAHRLVEEVGLEAVLLGLSSHVVPDGPTRQEALASEARLSGRWVEVAERLTARQERPPRAPKPSRKRGGGSRNR